MRKRETRQGVKALNNWYPTRKRIRDEYMFLLYKFSLLVYTYICEKLSNAEMGKGRFQVEV